MGLLLALWMAMLPRFLCVYSGCADIVQAEILPPAVEEGIVG